MSSKWDAKYSAAAVALLAGLVVAGCKQEANLTRVPGFATVERDQRPSETTLFLAVPVNVAAVKDAADAAIGNSISKWRSYIDDIACGKRKGPWTECNGAVVQNGECFGCYPLVRDEPRDVGPKRRLRASRTRHHHRCRTDQHDLTNSQHEVTRPSQHETQHERTRGG